jgi:hypothetical protein
MMEYLQGVQDRFMESIYLFFTPSGWKEIPTNFVIGVNHMVEIIGGLFT